MALAGKRGDMNTVRMLTEEQGKQYTGLGRVTFRKWAREIGAAKKYGPRCVRYDRHMIDRALDQMGTGGEAE